MRASRLLSTLILLQLRGRLTAEALAAEFEVSVRTVYRDIDELSAAGIPVFADRGPGGGFQLHKGYRTTLTGLTPSEAAALLLAGLPGPAADLGLAEPTALARLKLLAAVSPDMGAAAERVGRRLHVDPVDWYHRKPAPGHLRPIAQAVWSETRLRLRYESWDDTVDRTVDPLGLVIKAGAWYLVARVGRQIRTYKVANVRTLQLLEQRFVYPTAFDLGRYWARQVTRFESGLRKGTATLRVSPAALSRLDRIGADMAEPIRLSRPDSSGWRQATVPIESVTHAASLLLGFADDVEVVAPHALRAALAGNAKRVVRLYGG